MKGPVGFLIRLLSYLRTWGCLSKVNILINKKRKLGPKTVDCVFLEYAQRSIAYIFLVVKSEIPDVHVDSIMESRDAIFFKNIFPMKDMHSPSRFSSEITPEPIAPNVTETSKQPVEREEILEKDDSEAPRRSKRQKFAKSFGDGFIVYLVDDIPTTIAEAYASPDADDWKELSKVRWTRFYPMVCGNSLNDPMVANLWVVNGCSRRSLGLIVLLRSTRLGFWPKVTHKRKAKTSLTHTHLLLD